jgi:uncharacterized damage-inducible protein DinB
VVVTRELLLDLFDHMEWADGQVWTAALKDDATSSDAKLRHYLLHTASVQRAFLDAWMNQPLAFRAPYDDTSLPAELSAVRRYYMPARTYLGSIDPPRLSELFVVPWVRRIERQIKRVPAPTTRGETVLQMISHTTYHRGQANARLRQLGTEPPLVDYIAWLWFGRPQPDWPVVV